MQTGGRNDAVTACNSYDGVQAFWNIRNDMDMFYFFSNTVTGRMTRATRCLIAINSATYAVCHMTHLLLKILQAACPCRVLKQQLGMKPW